MFTKNILLILTLNHPLKKKPQIHWQFLFSKWKINLDDIVLFVFDVIIQTKTEAPESLLRNQCHNPIFYLFS